MSGREASPERILEYNLPSPPTLFVPGLLRGSPINLDPATLRLLPGGGRSVFVGNIFNESAERDVRGGEKGVVAVKVVDDGRFRVPRNARREATLLGKMDHVNVLSLFNAYLEPATPPSSFGRILIFTPYYPLPLLSLLNNPAFVPSPPSTSTPVAADRFSSVAHALAFQMILAVAYIHSQGIAHRDVGPNNFVVGRSGVLVLIDFGISIESAEERDDEPPGRMHFEVGTGPYRAPELLFGSRDYDPFAIDLWALGATIAGLFRPFEPLETSHPPSDSGSDAGSDAGSYWEEEREGDVAKQPTRQTLFKTSPSEFALIGSIFKVLGTPTMETWPSPFVHLLPDLLQCSAAKRKPAAEIATDQSWIRPEKSIYFSTQNPDVPATHNLADTLAFLARINLPAETAHEPASLALLSKLLMASHLSCPYDTSALHVKKEEWNGPNKEIVLGKSGGTMELGPGNFDRIVNRHMGGYCYALQTNFAAFLRGFGFKVSEVGGRVYVLVAASVSKNESFLLKAEPLPVNEDASLYRDPAPGWTFYRRILGRGEGPITSPETAADGPGHWSPLYHFTVQTLDPSDITMQNFYNECHPAAPFLSFFVVSVLLPSGARRTLSYGNPPADMNTGGATTTKRQAKLYSKEGIHGQEFDVEFIDFEIHPIRDVLAREFGFKFP
ncbi:arylamine N-acetyltransferase [Pseudohyphozyma bogoriensis]|nr:arylamine N-acetyltransferase [Pseudohyphozyma bogoriensis]